jgi:hypothetical protein
VVLRPEPTQVLVLAGVASSILVYNQQMGFSFEVDDEQKTARWSLTGEVTDASFRESLRIVNGILVGLDLRGGIIDFTGATSFGVSEDSLTQLARTNPVLPREMLRLIVAPEDHAFRMSRTFVELSEVARPNIFVVRSIDAANHMLGIRSPQYRVLASSD